MDVGARSADGRRRQRAARVRDALQRRRRRRGLRRAPRLGSGGARAGRLLGHRADHLRRRRPGRLRAGAAPRPGRPGGDDRGLLRVRQRTDDGRRLHRGRHGQARARRVGQPRALQRGRVADRPRSARCGGGGRAAPRLPPRAQPRRGAAPTDGRPARPTGSGGRRADADDLDGQLRRARRGAGDLRRRRVARAAWQVGAERGHRVHRLRRHGRRRRGQPTDRARRHARHPRIAEGGALRGDVRRVQPADRHHRRHARLLPRQGPRVARHDPPRCPAGVRLRPGYRAAHLPDPAQELRRRVHRHGLQDDGQRPVPRLAGRRAGRDGRRSGGGDPPAAGDRRRARRVRGGLRRTAPQPVHRRRTRTARRGDRAGRDASGDRRGACAPWPTSASASPAGGTTTHPSESSGAARPERRHPRPASVGGSDGRMDRGSTTRCSVPRRGASPVSCPL